MTDILLTKVNEGNLKNISLKIPRDKLILFTGVSGSGKSTLAIDTIYQECQRQYLEAMGFQGISKPDLESIENLSPSIRITQSGYNKNPRSSVGTSTDIYTSLRMIYEKVGKRTCQNCNEEIFSNECKEEVEKLEGEFKVYMYCNHCGYKMEKLTRTHFSYNTREGACANCEGLGEVISLDKSKVVNENLSLEDGAVDYWNKGYKDYQINNVEKTFKAYGLDYQKDEIVKNYSKEQKALLYYGTESEEVKELFKGIKSPKAVADGKFEGVATLLWRRISDKGGKTKEAKLYFTSKTCKECGGERLNSTSRNVTVSGVRLPQLVKMSLKELYEFTKKLDRETNDKVKVTIEPYILDLITKLNRIIKVGLGYLNIDRQMMTLSGGESQRIKLSATLDSDMTGMIYILDEPTASLHPKDTSGIVEILKGLRDKGNTLIVIEHDIDVMREADFIVDIGPGAGTHGGEIVASGSLKEIIAEKNSITGKYLKIEEITKREYREHDRGYISIRNADKYNLKGVNVDIPIGVMTSVTGVSGSGKSTLIFEVLLKNSEKVDGLESFDDIVIVDQNIVNKMKRSNVATYSEVYTEIRNVFGKLEDAKEKNLTPRHFSFNTSGGRCDNCEGLGYVVSNMLFFEDLEVECPICEGKRFKDNILSIKYKGNSISEILNTSVEDAVEIFKDNKKILETLKMLEDIGLSYLTLGQTMTTLSGGEGQRLKLARELIKSKGKKNLYLMDEPTRGLSDFDVENFLLILQRLVNSGNTVVLVEHNVQIMNSSDWIIDVGPSGGVDGGNIIAIGTPEEIALNESSITGKYLY